MLLALHNVHGICGGLGCKSLKLLLNLQAEPKLPDTAEFEYIYRSSTNAGYLTKLKGLHSNNSEALGTDRYCGDTVNAHFHWLVDHALEQGFLPLKQVQGRLGAGQAGLRQMYSTAAV